MKLQITRKSDCIVVGQRLKKLRQKLGFTCKDFANTIGRNRSYVSGIENGSYVLSPRLIDKIERTLRITIKHLLYDVEFSDLSISEIQRQFQNRDDEAVRKVPIIGETEAGFPTLFCEEMLEEAYHNFKTIAVSNFIGEQLFALKVKGYSMSPRILPDDIVIMSSSRQVKQGDLCVTVNIDNESTLKILETLGDSVILKPLNPQYNVLVYKKEEVLQILPVLAILATPSYS